MITAEELKANLKLLKSQIPVKPERFTSDFPTDISEALLMYLNQRTVHLVQSVVIVLNDENWPLPLYVDQKKIKVGLGNWIVFYRINKKTKIRPFQWLSIPLFSKISGLGKFDESMVELFEANFKRITYYLTNHPVLSTKRLLLNEALKTYKKEYWAACICTLFPIIDYVTRRLLKTNELKKGVKQICNLFKEVGFGIENTDNLMPHMASVNLLFRKKIPLEEGIKTVEELEKTDFGFIGAALSSFLFFANRYYSYYVEDHDENVLNRHAIIHGSANNYWNRCNAARIISFLFLMLELESVFKTLFNSKSHLSQPSDNHLL